MDGEHLKEVAAQALAENVEGLNRGEQLMAWLGEAKGWVERLFPGRALDLSIKRALGTNELGTPHGDRPVAAPQVRRHARGARHPRARPASCGRLQQASNLYVGAWVAMGRTRSAPSLR
jgi:hypothetical protein